MERVWIFERLAISVARVDFLDPAVADQPDPRERGVRVEVRPARATTNGTIYVSSSWDLQPATCRIDFLESAPGAADRMHWHPTMHEGEPGDRTFDSTMPPDPVGWLTSYLLDLGDPQVSTAVDEIGAEVAAGLVWARQPWPNVEHDERGMAPSA